MLLRAHVVSGMDFIPYGDRVIVQELEAEAVSKGGVIIPDIAQEKPQEGLVLAVGPGRWDENWPYDPPRRIPVDVRLGDRVLYTKYVGTEITDVTGEKYLILSARDVLAVRTSSPPAGAIGGEVRGTGAR